MSAVHGTDNTSKSASKKKKKSKKKANGRAPDAAESAQANGVKHEAGQDADEDDDDDDVPETLRVVKLSEDTLHMPSSPPAPASPIEARDPPTQNGAQQSPQQKVEQDERETVPPSEPDASAPAPDSLPSETTARLDALQQERDLLREEVTRLRQSLESIQTLHSEQRTELEQTQQGKENAELQYRNLLGKVNTIRSQLGERLKQDAEELEQARRRIEELEASNSTIADENQRLQETITEHRSKLDAQTGEIESLRSRTNLSTSNWVKERDEMVSREAYIREEYEVAKQAMQDWEILATDERSRREALEERVGDLEDQLGGSRDAYERVRNETETQGSTVDGLQRALRDLQDERKRELREMVEQSQAQLDELKKQASLAESGAEELKQHLEAAKKDLDRALPFEKEVREKNLLIGKLRHEAVILNDHLTKALRFLKRGKVEDNVDRQLVTNHFLHFLALDRSDAKKFQILQLIAALLGWDEAQKEQAGLLRTGAGALGFGSGTMGSLRLPVSPFRRTPSTPTLSSDFVPETPGLQGRESLAELWSEFLEREAEAGGGGGGGVGSSRRGSVAAKSVRSTSFASQGGGGGGGGSGGGVASPSSGVPPVPALPAGVGRQSPEVKRTESGGGTR
ncbi:hypothetical protein LTS14_008661 [Recurvomyces mirabilis]|uniref:uncharacterized protein n=1 Tax=Recurvomyces mirabilis TaxID=574656 RepID=UPI002DDE0C29|nr:hypothetical protein LTS14_008661 [Recurvomyces mirabilis]